MKSILIRNCLYCKGLYHLTKIENGIRVNKCTTDTYHIKQILEYELNAPDELGGCNIRGIIKSAKEVIKDYEMDIEISYTKI